MKNREYLYFCEIDSRDQHIAHVPSKPYSLSSQTNSIDTIQKHPKASNLPLTLAESIPSQFPRTTVALMKTCQEL